MSSHLTLHTERQGARITVSGIVQGVGFRPFVYNLASTLGVLGWIRNTSGGVEILVAAPRENLDQFILLLEAKAPPLARIDEILVARCPPDSFTRFEILHSETIPGGYIPVSPDVGICQDCLNELFNPHDRRFRYPFINCTNCGPRFTIIQDLPYDRPNTTMATFTMCPACAAEYQDPTNRRFHAQPIACPVCGPEIWLEMDQQVISRRENALRVARQLLAEGKILAVKGLGGFHLACDATHQQAVATLRQRKLRVDKPFALMMPDLETIRIWCDISPCEAELLSSPARPIVLLNRKKSPALRTNRPINDEVAPGQRTLGVMLPYTPLHYLLLEPAPGYPQALVMTSGNLREEPIAYRNGDSQDLLPRLADAFLFHNRPIHTRCDDSVFRAAGGKCYPIRRARGFAPDPIHLTTNAPPVLATGAELKNTFCLTRDRYAFLSQHIGDLENFETLQAYEEAIAYFEKLFRISPEVFACDLHPDYLATRYAHERAARENLPVLSFQHHHAHIAACLVDNRLAVTRPVIGVALDGTGYGQDGAIWGGEFLLTEGAKWERAFHLAYFPMPGGDAAVREPWRLALAWLAESGIPWTENLPPVRAVQEDRRSILQRQLSARINTPLTSSFGRLFDAAAALAGVRQQINYEAQAAIEFENLCDPGETSAYPFDLGDNQIDTTPLCEYLVKDILHGTHIGTIAARFHNTVTAMVLEVCDKLRQRTGLAEVALSGGVWQNMVLLRNSVSHLQAAGFTVYVHEKVPPNDGGLALGQAALATQVVR